MEQIMNVLNNLVLLALGLSTFIGILDYIGFLPNRMRKWFRLNRTDDMVGVLQDIGVDIKRYKRVNQSLKYPRVFGNENIEKTTLSSLEQFKISKSMAVGHFRPTKLGYYYDLIGGTCDCKVAEYFANLLCTYWAQNSLSAMVIKDVEFDFIVTPKGGSPILGYEFSKLVDKPLVLHEESPRFKDNEEDMRYWFDCSAVPEKGKKALIVDDSTTGGTMVSNIIEHLREYGYLVNTCLVVFEPKAKNARERIEQKDVQLVSIIETHL